MEKLLQWSIANSQGDKEAMKRAGQPDPKLLQQLFGGGGPDDPTLMKESIKIVQDPEVSLENKLIAMDNFEMLIENLDNANNIENMKLWDPILEFLDYEEEELRTYALSIIGTAVQNNTNSQDSFIKYDNGLRKVIQIAASEKQPLETRTKAFYALSNSVRNHPVSARKFEELKGLDIIAPILNDKETKPKLKMRAIGLLSAFLSAVTIDEKLMTVFRKDSLIEAVMESLSKESNLNLIDRVLDFLSQLISAGIKFTETELELLRNGFEHIEPLKDRLNEDIYQIVKYVLKK